MGVGQGSAVIEGGEVARIARFSRDITDRRRERQLRVMDDLLRHDPRDDVNAILGRAEMAREGADPAVADSMGTVLATGQRPLETAAKERETIDILAGIDDTERLDLGDSSAVPSRSWSDHSRRTSRWNSGTTARPSRTTGSSRRPARNTTSATTGPASACDSSTGLSIPRTTTSSSAARATAATSSPPRCPAG